MVAGEAAQTAALLRSGQVDALSQFDTQYALTENAGVKLRMLDKDNEAIARFPVERLRRAGGDAQEQARAVGRARAGLCQGHGVRDGQPGGRDPHPVGGVSADQADRQGRGDALRDDVKTLEARAKNWPLEAGGVTKWGENSEQNYTDYVDFLVKNGVLKERIAATDLVTNDLIDDINKFDAAAIEKQAKGYR